MFPYENGDVEVWIQHARFLVSSSVMSQTSPEFHKLFTQHGSLCGRIELPDEDPMAFRLICQSAHGSFIPQTHISLQTLVNMADAIRRYKIPAASRVHNTVAYSFIVQTLRPETLSTEQILKLLRVAKVLGSAKYEQLLQDVFFLRPLEWEVLPIEPIAGDRDTDGVILLTNLMLRGAACRAEMASTLLRSPRDDETLHLHERNDLAVWILKGSPSLQEISARFQSMRSAVDLQREQLLDASAAIQEATADIGCYVRTTFGNDQEREEGRTEEIVEVDAHQKIKRLEVQIAKDGRMSRKSLDVYDLDLERVPSNDTEFEDIEAYGGPIGSMCDDYLDFKDDKSVRSIKTV